MQTLTCSTFTWRQQGTSGANLRKQGAYIARMAARSACRNIGSRLIESPGLFGYACAARMYCEDVQELRAINHFAARKMVLSLEVCVVHLYTPGTPLKLVALTAESQKWALENQNVIGRQCCSDLQEHSSVPSIAVFHEQAVSRLEWYRLFRLLAC